MNSKQNVLKMADENKAEENKTIPAIQITLTIFTNDENGHLSQSYTGPAKIDGEVEPPNEIMTDCPPALKSECIRNLLFLSFGQFLLGMAFDTLSDAQGIINAQENIGQVSLIVLYGFLVVSSLFLPTVTIKRLGCKKTLVYATILFCPYILANFHTSRSTLIPTAILCGLASGPLSCARSIYINRISRKHAGLHRCSTDMMKTWFFSVCTVFNQNAEIWGSLLSHYVLRISDDSEQHVSTSTEERCGTGACDDGFSSVVYQQIPHENGRFILVAILTALSLIAAFFLAFFLEPLEIKEPKEALGKGHLTLDLKATCYQFSNLNHILLFPLSLYAGLVDGFYNGDFKKIYVTCAWGFPHVVKVAVCHGVISAVISSVSAPCIHVLGRSTLFILAAVVHLVMFLTMYMWKPDNQQTIGFFLIAGALGIGNGVWMSQLVALYGILFKEKEEAGFSCFYLLNSLGFFIAYSYSSYFCTNVKIFIPLGTLVIGMICYLIMEVRTLKKFSLGFHLKAMNTER